MYTLALFPILAFRFSLLNFFTFEYDVDYSFLKNFFQGYIYIFNFPHHSIFIEQ